MCVGGGGGGVQIYLRFIDNSLSYTGLFKDMIFSWQVEKRILSVSFCIVCRDSLMYTELQIRGEYLVIVRDSFCQFCINTYVVTPHLNCPNEMRVTTYGFSEK